MSRNEMQSDDPTEQDLTGAVGSEVDGRVPSSRTAAYLIGVECRNCGWKGVGKFTKGEPVPDGMTATEYLRCPWCGCKTVGKA